MKGSRLAPTTSTTVMLALSDALAIAVMISVHTRGRTIKRLIENSIWVLRTYASRALGRTRFV